MTTPSTRGVFWLLLAALLLLFAQGRFIIPATAWLAPLFFIRYLRTQPLRRGLPTAAAAMIATQLMAWKGLVPIPFLWLYILVMSGTSLLMFSPFLVDRLVADRLRGFRSTLVFPLAWVAMEYVNSILSPYGTWGAVAYTQFGNLPLLQMVSITGIFGVTFLIGWFAAVANWAWEQQFAWPRVRRGVLAHAGVLCGVLLFGAARLAIVPSTAETVRIASVTVDRRLPEFGPMMEGRTFGVAATEAQLDAARLATYRLHDELFSLTRREVQAGAELVFWSELNGIVLVDDEPQLIARGRAFAEADRVYLLMALMTVTLGERNAENKVVAIDPSGEILTTYIKSFPVPGAERSVVGPGVLPVLDTPFGRISIAICYDMDFHELIRQAGRADADIMIAPSSDWKEIDPLHTHMALLRGIENGMTVIRQTHTGLSAAADHQGRVLSKMDHFTTVGDRAMVTQAPMRGVATIYAAIGDVFARACLVAFAFLLFRAFAHSAAGLPARALAVDPRRCARLTELNPTPRPTGSSGPAQLTCSPFPDPRATGKF
jgi:apolipoprotein N-acyltransferase